MKEIKKINQVEPWLGQEEKKAMAEYLDSGGWLTEFKKTKEFEEALIRLGVLSEIFRIRESRKIRAGRGKSRGRKMKQAVGPLIVVAENRGAAEAAQNIPGVEVTTVANLNAEMLAPGTHPGRLTVWTSGAIEKLGALYGKGE